MLYDSHSPNLSRNIQPSVHRGHQSRQRVTPELKESDTVAKTINQATKRERIRIMESMSPVKSGIDMASGARFNQPISSRIEHRLPYANIVYDDDFDDDDDLDNGNARSCPNY